MPSPFRQAQGRFYSLTLIPLDKAPDPILQRHLGVVAEVAAGAGYVGPGQLWVGSGIIALYDSGLYAQFGLYKLYQMRVCLRAGIAQIVDLVARRSVQGRHYARYRIAHVGVVPSLGAVPVQAHRL